MYDYCQCIFNNSVIKRYTLTVRPTCNRCTDTSMKANFTLKTVINALLLRLWGVLSGMSEVNHGVTAQDTCTLYQANVTVTAGWYAECGVC
jgi:hypothetical protein